MGIRAATRNLKRRGEEEEVEVEKEVPGSNPEVAGQGCPWRKILWRGPELGLRHVSENKTDAEKHGMGVWVPAKTKAVQIVAQRQPSPEDPRRFLTKIWGPDLDEKAYSWCSNSAASKMKPCRYAQYVNMINSLLVEPTFRSCF